MATGMQGLLMWCKIITKPYGDDIAVKNMTTSWKNGLAFCAIIHHFRPDLIDFDKLSKENVAENNALAFTTAEDELGIPALLDVEDMVEMRVPDRLSIMTYVSQYYNYFRDKVPGEIEPRRVISKKRSTKEPSESLPAKRGLEDHHITPVLQKTIPTGIKNICWSCGKMVYLMERLSIEGKLFHRICFKCIVCGKQLKNSTYEYDKVEAKFYCSKDYNYKKENEVVKTDKHNDSPTYPPKEMEHPDVPETKSNSLKNTLKSPFKRNEPFKRQGIHPQSPPNETDDGIVNVIKSKEESTKVKGKSKHAKSLFSNVIGKKHKDKQHEFTNPSYDKQLDLSNFMNQLDKTNEPILLSSREGIHPDLGETNIYEPINRLPRVIGHKSVNNENLEQTSIEKGTKDKVTKGHKKKLVLKLKKKKEKKVIIEDNSKENSKSEQSNKIKNDVTLPKHSSVSQEEYENVTKYMKMKPIDNAEKIYDNINLCKVITSKTGPDLQIYDNANLQPIARSFSDGKKEDVKKYGEETNVYAVPNIGIRLQNNSPPNKYNEHVIYESMGSIHKEVIDSESNNVEDSSAQYMCLGKYGHVKCDIPESIAGNMEEDNEVSSDNEIIDNNAQNEIIQSNIRDSDLISGDASSLHGRDDEDTSNDNCTNIKDDDLTEDSNEFVDDNPENSIDELIAKGDCEMEYDNFNGNLDDVNAHVPVGSSLIESNNGDIAVSSKDEDNGTVEILEGNQVSVCDTSVDNQVRNEECGGQIHLVDDDDDMVIEESSKGGSQNSLRNVSSDIDIQNEKQEVPYTSTTKCNEEESIEMENSSDVTENSEVGQSYLNIRANLKKSKIIYNENTCDAERLPEESKFNEDCLSNDSPTGNVYVNARSVLRKTSEETPDIEFSKQSKKTTVGEDNEPSQKRKTTEEILIEARLALGSTGRLESECKLVEGKSSSQNLETKVEEQISVKDFSVDNDHNENGKQVDEIEHMDTESTTGMHIQLDENVFVDDINISKSKPSNEGIPIHAQSEYCPSLHTDLNVNQRESLFIISNENSSDEFYLEDETETNNIVEGETNRMDNLFNFDDSVVPCEGSIADHVEFKTSSLADDEISSKEIMMNVSVVSSEGSMNDQVEFKTSSLADDEISSKEIMMDVSVVPSEGSIDDKVEFKTSSLADDEIFSKEIIINDSGLPCEGSIDDQVKLKTSSSADDGTFSEEIKVTDDSSIVETDNNVEANVSSSVSLNPFLSSDSSPEMSPIRETTNPFLSCSDDDDDDFDTQMFDDSNPFAEDVRLERNNTLERPKDKPSGPGIFQIGILEETNPFADDVLDPSNPFSDEFDDDNLSIAETTDDVKTSKNEERTHVPQIVGSIPKTDKKMVLKTRTGVTVRKNSNENSLNSTLTRKPRPKKRVAPKLPPVSVSAPNTPPISNRQSTKKRHAPKPPDASNYDNKFNSIDRRNDASRRQSLRKRKAPEPPKSNTFEMKGELDDTYDEKSDYDLSNASNVIDNAQFISNMNEDLSDKYDITAETECDSLKKDEQEDDSALSGNLSESHSTLGGNLLDSHNLNLVEVSTSDAQYVVDGPENLDKIIKEQIDASISDVQPDFEYEKQSTMNSTEEFPNLEASNIRMESSDDLSMYGSADQRFPEDIDTSTSHLQSHHISKEQISLNSKEDLANTQESNISIESSNTQSPSVHEIDVESDITTYTSHIQSDIESKDKILNSTDDLSNLEESNVSIASSDTSISHGDSINKSIDSVALEGKFSSNLSMETQNLNADIISSISSNQEESISNSSTECDEDERGMNEHESIHEGKVLEHLRSGTTNSLPRTKFISEIPNSELRSSLPNIYSSNRQYSEKRKAPPKPPRQYVEYDGSQGDISVYKQPKREEMARELQFLEIKQRELEMEGVVMEKKLRESSDGEPEEAYLLTWFELVNQKNNLLRRENELIYMCQEIDFLQNQRSVEFELRQLMMKPADEKTEYDTNREEELLAEILRYVTKRSNIIDQLDEDRIRENAEDKEISSMMIAQGLRTSSCNIKEKSDQGVTKKKNKEKKAVKEKKESKAKKKSKEKTESNGITNHPEKEKNGVKELNREKIDSKMKKKKKQEKKENKEKNKKVSVEAKKK